MHVCCLQVTRGRAGQLLGARRALGSLAGRSHEDTAAVAEEEVVEEEVVEEEVVVGEILMIIILNDIKYMAH